MFLRYTFVRFCLELGKHKKLFEPRKVFRAPLDNISFFRASNFSSPEKLFLARFTTCKRFSGAWLENNLGLTKVAFGASGPKQWIHSTPNSKTRLRNGQDYTLHPGTKKVEARFFFPHSRDQWQEAESLRAEKTERFFTKSFCSVSVEAEVHHA